MYDSKSAFNRYVAWKICLKFSMQSAKSHSINSETNFYFNIKYLSAAIAMYDFDIFSSEQERKKKLSKKKRFEDALVVKYIKMFIIFKNDSTKYVKSISSQLVYA